LRHARTQPVKIFYNALPHPATDVQHVFEHLARVSNAKKNAADPSALFFSAAFFRAVFDSTIWMLPSDRSSMKAGNPEAVHG
jgi:hypothetical protein